MNLEMRVRWVHLKFIEKELKIFLVQSGSAEHSLPEGFEIKPPAGGDHILEMRSPFVEDEQQFIGQADKIPILKRKVNDQYLAVDLYVLVQPELILSNAENGKWLSVQEALKLNIDVSAVIHKTLKKLKEELNYQPIEHHLLPKEFTIPELQILYEAILDKKLNRGNFYRKMMILDILDSKGLRRTGRAHASSIFYTFNKNYYKKTEEGLFKGF